MALYKTTTATDQNVDTTLRDHYWDPPHITSVQYCGCCSVQWGDSFNTVGDSFSTVEVVQYSGGITSVDVGDNISTVGENISTVEGYLQYCGG